MAFKREVNERMSDSTNLFGNDVGLTEKTLDLLWQRQKVTQNNIANVDTPNYKAQYLTFEDELARRIRTSNATGRATGGNRRQSIGDAIDHTTASLHTTTAESTRMDDNSVDMDQEQVDLAETTYEYQMMVQAASNQLKRLDSATKIS
jgi:flagellar basal-body rod protein FlgB